MILSVIVSELSTEINAPTLTDEPPSCIASGVDVKERPHPLPAATALTAPLTKAASVPPPDSNGTSASPARPT
jgi:hypothetical protein